MSAYRAAPAVLGHRLLTVWLGLFPVLVVLGVPVRREAIRHASEADRSFRLVQRLFSGPVAP